MVIKSRSFSILVIVLIVLLLSPSALALQCSEYGDNYGPIADMNVFSTGTYAQYKLFPAVGDVTNPCFERIRKIAKQTNINKPVLEFFWETAPSSKAIISMTCEKIYNGVPILKVNVESGDSYYKTLKLISVGGFYRISTSQLASQATGDVYFCGNQYTGYQWASGFTDLSGMEKCIDEKEIQGEQSGLTCPAQKCTLDSECNDDLFCNGVEICAPENPLSGGNGCLAGSLDLSDDVSCSVDTCNEETDIISHTLDNSLCEAGSVCKEGGCAIPQCSDYWEFYDLPIVVSELYQGQVGKYNLPIAPGACVGRMLAVGNPVYFGKQSAQSFTCVEIFEGVPIVKLDDLEKVQYKFLDFGTDGGNKYIKPSFGPLTIPVCKDNIFKQGGSFGFDSLQKVQNCIIAINSELKSELYCPGIVKCTTDVECSDGLFCNGAETCEVGSHKADVKGCVAGVTKIPIDDGVSCTLDICNEATDQLENNADDSFCTVTQFCGQLGCQEFTSELACQIYTNFATLPEHNTFLQKENFADSSCLTRMDDVFGITGFVHKWSTSETITCMEIYRGIPLIKVDALTGGNVYQALNYDNPYAKVDALLDYCTTQKAGEVGVLDEKRGFQNIVDLKKCIDNYVAAMPTNKYSVQEVTNCLPFPEVCDNAIDDNGNGLVDCDDLFCHSALVCSLGDVTGDNHINADDVAWIKQNPVEFWESWVNKDLNKLHEFIKKIFTNWGNLN